MMSLALHQQTIPAPFLVVQFQLFVCAFFSPLSVSILFFYFLQNQFVLELLFFCFVFLKLFVSILILFLYCHYFSFCMPAFTRSPNVELRWYTFHVSLSCIANCWRNVLILHVAGGTEDKWKGEEDKADKGRGGKTTSGNGQACSSASPRGQWRTGKMEKTGCKIICGVPTTLAVKGLMMMMYRPGKPKAKF